MGATGARGLCILTPSAFQIFPLSPDPRWQSSSPRPLALALQQALGQELARVRQGNPEVPGITVRLLQAMATLLSSPHGGTLALAMHHSHFLSCPLMRQLYQYQVRWHMGRWEGRALGDWWPRVCGSAYCRKPWVSPQPTLRLDAVPSMPEASLSRSRFPVFKCKKPWSRGRGRREHEQGQGPIVERERVRSLSPLSVCT